MQNVRDLIGGLSAGGTGGQQGVRGNVGGMTSSTEPTAVTDGSLVTLAVRDGGGEGGGEDLQSGDDGSKATVEPLWDMVLNGDQEAPTSPPPGLLVLNLTPSPTAGSGNGFRPLTTTTTTTTKKTTTKSITSEESIVTTDRQLIIEQDDAAIEINFTNKEDTSDTVTVKFTFEDEKANEVEDDVEDEDVLLYDEENVDEDDLEENVFLYDVVTDSPRTARPPLFDSLPMFEKDIFSSTFYEEEEEEEEEVVVI